MLVKNAVRGLILFAVAVSKRKAEEKILEWAKEIEERIEEKKREIGAKWRKL